MHAFIEGFSKYGAFSVTSSAQGSELFMPSKMNGVGGGSQWVELLYRMCVEKWEFISTIVLAAVSPPHTKCFAHTDHAPFAFGGAG